MFDYFILKYLLIRFDPSSQAWIEVLEESEQVSAAKKMKKSVAKRRKGGNKKVVKNANKKK